MRSGTIAFLIGVLVFHQLPELPPAYVRWFLPLCLILAFFCLKCRLIMLLACGFLWAHIHAYAHFSHGLSPALEGKDVVVQGQIASLPEAREHGIRFLMQVEGLRFNNKEHRYRGKLRLNWYRSDQALVAGESWQLVVRLKRPHGFMNPGGFDYEGWMYQRGIKATGYVRNNENNIRLSAAGLSVNRLRQHLSEFIDQSLPESKFRGLISALAIGHRQAITPAQWEILSRTGTNHLMAISGLHIGLVAGLVFFITRKLWAMTGTPVLHMPAPRLAALTAILAAMAYAALAGFSIPTQRAVIMVLVVMLSFFMSWRLRALDILLLALLCVLLFDPSAVLNAGFWLSFTAVAVIVFGMHGRVGQQKNALAYRNTLSIASRLWWKWGRVQWIVALGLLPLTLIIFQRMSLVSPLANLVAVPWMSLLVVPLVLCGVLVGMFVPQAGTWILSLADDLLALLWMLLENLSGLSLASWSQGVPSVWSMVLAACGVGLLLCPKGIPARWLGIVLVMPLFVVRPAVPEKGHAWFTLLDVGQGLSAVVQTQNHALVFDTGPRFNQNFDTGKAVVIPFLREQGITQLSMLILSHNDNDHAGGVRSVLGAMDVDRVVSGLANKDLPAERQPCSDQEAWEWDGVSFRFIHPPPDHALEGNDASCVLVVDTATGRVLMTGDITRKVEQRVLEFYPQWLDADILVIPHHGSNTSSSAAFIAAVSPEYGLIAAGYRNRYRLPVKKVVRRYQDAGVKLLNTAERGAVGLRLGPGISGLVPESQREKVRRFWHYP